MKGFVNKVFVECKGYIYYISTGSMFFVHLLKKYVGNMDMIFFGFFYLANSIIQLYLCIININKIIYLVTIFY